MKINILLFVLGLILGSLLLVSADITPVDDWDFRDSYSLYNASEITTDKVGIGTQSSSFLLDIVGSYPQIRLSSWGGIVARNSNQSEEEITAFTIASVGDATRLLFGGGSNLYNAATAIEFYAADYNNITQGTEIVEITTSGLEVKSGNLTTPEVKLSTDPTNHRIYDNATCIIITGDTSTLEIC